MSVPRSARGLQHTRLALVLLATAAANPFLARSQSYTFQQFDQDQGLDSPAVRALLQDRTGFLWVGTANGLYRYDGSHFRAYGEQEGLPDPTVVSLAESGDGTLWVGTSHGIARRLNNRLVPVAAPERLTMTREMAMISDGGRGVYVTTQLGLYAVTLDADRGMPVLRRVWPEANLPPRPAVALHRDSHGLLWFGCGLALCTLQDDRATRVTDPGLPEQAWTGIARDRADTLWVRSATGLYYRRAGTTRFVEEEQQMPTAGHLFNLFLDPDGDMAVPTQLGLVRRKQGRWQRLDSLRGLASDSVACIMWDREGSPWIGFETHGLARWIGYGDWESWTRLQGLSTNSVTSVARDTTGALYVGTKYGLNWLEAPGAGWKLWTERDGLQADQVRNLAADPSRGVWIGTELDGLSWLDPSSGRIHIFGPRAGLPSSRIASISVDSSGTLWVGTRDGLYRARPNGAATTFEHVPLPGNPPGENVYDVVQERPGRFWFASTHGLLLLEAGKWRRFGVSDGLRHQRLIALTLPGDGSIWVAYDRILGVSRLRFDDQGRMTAEHFTRTARHLGSNDISFLRSDRHGRIWVGTDAGVDEYENGVWSHYGLADGLIWPDTNLDAFLADPDDSVWFGTSGGLSHFRRTHTAALKAPEVVLTSIRSAGQPIDSLAGSAVPRIPHSDGILDIEFAALTFLNPGSIRFHYRLLGAGSPWTETDGSKVAFPSLPAGSYTFEVAASRGREWSAPVAFSFEVLAPWWASTLFQLGLALLFALLTVAVWRLRVRRLMEAKDRLKTAVRERTQQLELERDRTQQEKALVEEQKVEIERLLGQARELNRLKDEFLANISHEIRTPMNGVLGMTALALATELSSEQREYLQTVQFSARNLLRLLNEILDFSKIEAGRMELEFVPCSVSECARESLKTLASLAREKQLYLHLDIRSGTPDSLIADPQRMRQILLNLVSNAIKFTDRGGVTVAIAAEHEEARRVTLRLTVSDTGIGIPQEKRSVIFEPFRQADGSTTRKYGGTGLGLAICARLIRLMSGSIWVESEPGVGSRFHVLVTLAKNLAPDGVQAELPLDYTGAAGSTGIGGPVQVLLVEDDPVSRRIASRILEKRGYGVINAGNGREALEMLDHISVELILMDVQMPEVDGLAATRIIREREASGARRLPIYILTANAMSGDRERCLAAGADGYLTKPIEPAELIRALDEIRLRLAR